MTEDDLNKLRDLILLAAKELTADEWIDKPMFRQLYKYGETATDDMFRNADLIRRKILIKTTDVTKNGGWRLNRRRYDDWASNNAHLSHPSTRSRY